MKKLSELPRHKGRGDSRKLAANVIKYHDVESADVEKVHTVLVSLAEKVIEEVEQSLGIDDTQIGPLEEKILGEV